MKNKKWKNYQVDSPIYSRKDSNNPNCITTVKTVAELTEAEAKNELCLAMDLIEKLLTHSHNSYNDMLDSAKKAHYAP
jgi:hypothetical protein